MTRNEIKHLKRMRESEKQSRPLGFSVSILSIAYGAFILYYESYFISLLQPRLMDIQPEYLGVPLLLFGILKITGMLLNCGWLRRISIISLAFIWGGLFVVNLAYALGDGYPNPMFLFMGKNIFDCMSIALKGRFD